MHEPNQVDNLVVTREVRRMVSLSSARVSDRIAVVGPQSLDYLVALCRSGFESVVCVSVGSPRACGEPIDHLFVTGPMEDDQLAAIVSSIGRRLHADGTLAARLREAGQDRVISEALGGLGLVDARPVVDSSGTVVASHRLSQPAAFAVAA